MVGFREKVNSHLPTLLQVLSTISLVVLALCALCGSQSLKKIAEDHSVNMQNTIEGIHRH